MPFRVRAVLWMLGRVDVGFHVWEGPQAVLLSCSVCNRRRRCGVCFPLAELTESTSGTAHGSSERTKRLLVEQLQVFLFVLWWLWLWRWHSCHLRLGCAIGIASWATVSSAGLLLLFGQMLGPSECGTPGRPNSHVVID